MPLSHGEVFAGYRIHRRLGSGGMGEVYLAHHPTLPKRVALKLLAVDLSANGEFRTRFAHEAELASQLDHPNVVSVYDRGSEDDRLWISMQYVDGSDARNLLTKHVMGIPAPQVVSIVSAVAEALDYAHGNGLLHRDVKPHNIFLASPQTGVKRILLGDFGIARSLRADARLTEPQGFLGTYSYAAPEQQLGGDIDGRADQYALAVTAYELLTGSLPFEHHTLAGLVNLHLNATHPRLSSRRADLAELDPVLAVALSKDPRQRFTTCGEFANALSSALRGSDTPPPVFTSSEPDADNIREVADSRPCPTTRMSTALDAPPYTVHRAQDSERSVAPSGGQRGPFVFGAVAAVVVLVIAATALALNLTQRDRPATGAATSTSKLVGPPATSAPIGVPTSSSVATEVVPLPNASTSDVRSVGSGKSAHLVDVRMAGREGFDRIVFEFADAVPGYTIGYRPLPAYMDASGQEIPLADADVMVRVSLNPATGDGWTDGRRTYFGPSTVAANTVVITEGKAAGDFEAVLTWVVGMRAMVPFRVLTLDGPPRLVIDFQQ